MEEERGKERKRVSSGLKRALSGHFMTFWTTLAPQQDRRVWQMLEK